MPTREAISDSILPKEVPKPIPVRVVSTRGRMPKAAPAQALETQNGNQRPTVGEPSAAVPAPIAEEPVKLSPQLSALARKEQAFRQREQAFKAQEAQAAEWKSKAEKFDQLQAKIKAGDYSEVEALGADYENYTKFKVDRASSEDPVAQKMAALEQRIVDLTGKQEESANSAYEETVTEYRREIKQAISTKPDEFSSIKHFGEAGEKAVLQLILDSWEEDDLELTVEQACKDIEKEILEDGAKWNSLPKLKPAPAADPQTTEQPTQAKPGASTLTNHMLPPSGNPGPQKSLQHLSETERYAEARRRALAKRAQQTGA